MAEYLKLPEVARRLDVSEKTARRYVKTGALPSVFIGGAYRVSEPDLEEFLEGARVEPGKAPAPPSSEPTSEDDVLADEERRREPELAEGVVRRIRATLGDRMLRWSQEKPPQSGQQVLDVADALQEVLETPGLREAAASEYSSATALLRKLRDIARHLESADARERRTALREGEELVREQA